MTLLQPATNIFKPADNRGFIVSIGDTAPDFEVLMTDGSVFKLSDHRGKVVLLQFTASNCGVCKKVTPHIENRIWQPYKSHGLVLVGVDVGEPLDKILEFIKSSAVTYPFAVDGDAMVFKLFAKTGVTRNVLINKDGQIVFLTRLFDEKEFSELIDRVDELCESSNFVH